MRVKLKNQRLAEELAKRPLSLNGWALRLDLSSGHLSDLVNGRRPYPAPATRKKLLDALDLEFEELFEMEHRGRPRRRRPRPGAPQPSRLPRGFFDASRDRPRRRATVRGETIVPALVSDLRYALRLLKRTPGFTATAIVILAIGIGSNTALFSIVDSILWKPYPYADGDRLVVIGHTRGGELSSLSFPDFRDIREESNLLEGLAAWDWEPYNLAGDGEPMQVGGARVSAGFFDVLGVPPLAGRTFSQEDDRPGAAPVVVLSEGLWRGTFGSDPRVVGRSVRINSRPTTIVGVMPGRAEYPDRTVLWVPLAFDEESAPRGSSFLGSIGRIKEGVEISALDAELEGIAGRLEGQYPETNRDVGFAALTLRESLTTDMRVLSLSLLGVVTFVLLIVCANVANLLLSRGVGREREVAIRRALGADRRRLTQGLLGESLILALGGGVLGFFLGWLLVGRIVLLATTQIPPWIQTAMDLRVVVYTVGMTLAATMLCGLFPVLQSGRHDVAPALHRGSHQQIGSGRGGRLRASLVVAEVALSLVLLAGAGLMIQSLLEMSSVDPGFEPDGALRVGLDLLTEADAEREERAALFQRFLHRLAALPGVEAVGAVNYFPLDRRLARAGVSLPGQSAEEARRNPVPQVGFATTGYFQAMGIPLLRGEPFDPAAGTSAREVVVSERLARLLWPGEEALGQRIKIGAADSANEWFTVKGVVGDVAQQGLDREPPAQLYYPYARLAPTRMSIVLRSGSRDPAALTAAVRAAVHDVDPHQPLHDVVTLDELVHLSLWRWRFFTTLFWSFAAVATALALIGIYGVMSGVTAQRRREVGLRIALGADRGQVLRMVLRQGGRLVLLGLIIGLPLALALGRVLSGVLYGVDAVEPLTLIGIVLLLAVVSLGAVFLPARRAARVDPATSLRAE